MDAALQNICFTARKRDHTHRQREQEQRKIAALNAERDRSFGDYSDGEDGWNGQPDACEH